MASVTSSAFLLSSISLNKCWSPALWRNPRKLVVRATRTESKGVSLGSRAPHFELEEPLSGNMCKLDDFESYPALLVMFICNHCPFVKHLKKDIVKLTNLYMKKGLGVVAISSNSIVTHPQDGPVFMAEDARIFSYPFPYLYDPICNHKMLQKLMELFAHPSFTSLKRTGADLLNLYIMVSLTIHDQVIMLLSRGGT